MRSTIVPASSASIRPPFLLPPLPPPPSSPCNPLLIRLFYFLLRLFFILFLILLYSAGSVTSSSPPPSLPLSPCSSAPLTLHPFPLLHFLSPSFPLSLSSPSHFHHPPMSSSPLFLFHSYSFPPSLFPSSCSAASASLWSCSRSWNYSPHICSSPLLSRWIGRDRDSGGGWGEQG